MLDRENDRRRFGRIKLDAPLAAIFAGTPVRVIEISVTGFRVAHEGRLEPGHRGELTIEWEGSRFSFHASLVRTTLWRLARNLGERSLYHSGLRIVEAVGSAEKTLRELVAERIIRALEEQKANARGIPPLAAYMYQPGKGEIFRRCELIDGQWRKSETIRTSQPPNGFTISAEVDPQHVELLCQTWERTTAEGRRLTQLLAELSISSGEGVPTRRYVP